MLIHYKRNPPITLRKTQNAATTNQLSCGKQVPLILQQASYSKDRIIGFAQKAFDKNTFPFFQVSAIDQDILEIDPDTKDMLKLLVSSTSL